MPSLPSTQSLATQVFPKQISRLVEIKETALVSVEVILSCLYEGSVVLARSLREAMSCLDWHKMSR